MYDVIIFDSSPRLMYWPKQRQISSSRAASIIFLSLFLPWQNSLKLVHGLIELSNMQHTLNFCLEQPGRNKGCNHESAHPGGNRVKVFENKGATAAVPVAPVVTSLGIMYAKANDLLSNIFAVNVLPKYISYHLSSVFTDSQTVATYIIINRCL